MTDSRASELANRVWASMNAGRCKPIPAEERELVDRLCEEVARYEDDLRELAGS